MIGGPLGSVSFVATDRPSSEAGAAMAEAAIHHRDIPVSQRMDGQPWRVRLTEIVGSQSGPTTAFVTGVFGDKPLGCLALHELIRRLASLDMRGTVLVVPAANPPALEIGTRVSPAHLY